MCILNDWRGTYNSLILALDGVAQFLEKTSQIFLRFHGRRLHPEPGHAFDQTLELGGLATLSLGPLSRTEQI